MNLILRLKKTPPTISQITIKGISAPAFIPKNATGSQKRIPSRNFTAYSNELLILSATPASVLFASRGVTKSSSKQVHVNFCIIEGLPDI